MNVSLISVSPDAEKHMAYCARVSNPSNQENEKYAGLLRYCIKHQHWSIFEQAFMTLEINTTRGLAAQILRHRSFTYQEFSQRYADSSLLGDKIPLPQLRKQDEKNRQNSTDDLDPILVQELEVKMQKYFADGMKLYKEMLDAKVAKEASPEVPPLLIYDENKNKVPLVDLQGKFRSELGQLSGQYVKNEYYSEGNTPESL